MCTIAMCNTHMHIHSNTHIRTNQPLCCSSSFVLLPKDCMLGKPSASMAISQYSSKVFTLPWHFKWSYKTSLASLMLEASIVDLISSVMTPTRFSLSRLCFGLTTVKNSVSCFLRNSETESGAAALCEEEICLT